MRSFLIALQFLTVAPWFHPIQPAPEEIGRASSFFPLVGFLLGGILVLINRLVAPHVPAEILSLTLVTILAVLSRALHLDGLADTFDGLGAGGDRERILAVMDDSRSGVFGVLAIVLVIAFKQRALASMSDGRWQALLVAPVIARWAMVIAAYKARPAREGLGAIVITHMRRQDLLLATIIALTIAVLFSRSTGLWIFILVLLFSLGCKKYLLRRLGCMTGDTFGAVGELSETSALVLFALAQR